jgi:hypothetical protein
VNFVTCGRDKPLEERFIGTMRARAKNGASGSCPVDVSQHECHYHQRDGKPQTDQNGEDIECLFAHRHARWQQEGFNRQDYDWGRNCFLRALPHTFSALRAAQCGPLPVKVQNPALPTVPRMHFHEETVPPGADTLTSACDGRLPRLPELAGRQPLEDVLDGRQHRDPLPRQAQMLRQLGRRHARHLPPSNSSTQHESNTDFRASFASDLDTDAVCFIHADYRLDRPCAGRGMAVAQEGPASRGSPP